MSILTIFQKSHHLKIYKHMINYEQEFKMLKQVTKFFKPIQKEFEGCYLNCNSDSHSSHQLHTLSLTLPAKLCVLRSAAALTCPHVFIYTHVPFRPILPNVTNFFLVFLTTCKDKCFMNFIFSYSSLKKIITCF